jgi:hypothetical protein
MLTPAKPVSETVLLTALSLNFASNMVIVVCGAAAYCGRHVVRDCTASYGNSLGLCWSGFFRGFFCCKDISPEERKADEEKRSKTESMIDGEVFKAYLESQKNNNHLLEQLIVPHKRASVSIKPDHDESSSLSKDMTENMPPFTFVEALRDQHFSQMGSQRNHSSEMMDIEFDHD